MKLSEFYALLRPRLVEAVGPEPDGGDLPVIRPDSRQVRPGDGFLALPGVSRHGAEFIGDALRRGAVLVLTDRLTPADRELAGRTGARVWVCDDPLKAVQEAAWAWRARASVTVVGVTGSVGKTTTKEAIAAVLAESYRVLKSPGNLNTEVGLPLTLLYLEPHHQVAVLEMGMYQAGDIRFLCSIARPHVGVVTSVGPSHLARLGSLAAIADAKAELVESLPDSGTAVLNADDPIVSGFGARTAARAVTFGWRRPADFRAVGVELRGMLGVDFGVQWGGEARRLRVGLAGRPGLYAALAAVAVGRLLGVDWGGVERGLLKVAVDQRLAVRAGAGGRRVIDDSYNSSPVSLAAALEFLAQLPGRKAAILGDMLELGPIEAEAHREAGRLAARTVDILVAVGDRAALMAEAAREAGLAATYWTGDPVEAAALARSRTAPGDWILVKGSRGLRLERAVQALVGGEG